MASTEDQLTELFQSRNNHETRISVVEANIQGIRTDISKYNDEGTARVKMIQETINGFVRDINGIPRNNAERLKEVDHKIDKMKDDHCKPMAKMVDDLRKMNWMILGMGSLMALLIGAGFIGKWLGWF